MGYEMKKLGEYVDILPGYAFKSKDFSETGIPVIKIKNVSPPYVSLTDLSYVSQEIADANSKFYLKYDDVLIALTGSHINQIASVVGRVARVKYNEPSLLNQRVGKITVKDPNLCDINYVYYFLSQDSVKIYLASKAGGAANQANISPSDVKNVTIPLPDIEIQHRITDVLLAYDNLIENNQKQIKLLEEAAQRLYKEWFVDLRFPGYENTLVVDGVPEGWHKGVLGEIAEFKRGKTITKAQISDGIIPVVAGGVEPAYYHNKANATAPVVTVSGSGANAGFTRIYLTDIFASDCSYIDGNTTPSLFFVYCFLKRNKSRIDSLQKGSAQPHVYAKDINALRLYIPNVQILSRFCNYVEPYFELMGNLEKQSGQAKQARDYLLPKLMNGEVEV